MMHLINQINEVWNVEHFMQSTVAALIYSFDLDDYMSEWNLSLSQTNKKDARYLNLQLELSVAEKKMTEMNQHIKRVMGGRVQWIFPLLLNWQHYRKLCLNNMGGFINKWCNTWTKVG